jgi:hypothetical protein
MLLFSIYLAKSQTGNEGSADCNIPKNITEQNWDQKQNSNQT